MTPFDATQAARRFAAMEGNQQPIVDRFSMLPIGQYEDGSLTLAMPGFLKDAWEGAQRSYLDAGRVPVPDAPTGTRWSGDLDAFNAASLAPMAGVAGRVSGAIPRGALGSGGSDMVPNPRFAAFRERVNALTPEMEEAWLASKSPEKHALETPFQFVERPNLARPVEPYEADIPLAGLMTTQPSVWGHRVQSIAENGVRQRAPTGTIFDGHHLPFVRRSADGGYVLQDGNHRMSAEVVKGNDVARAIVSANDANASALPVLSSNTEETTMADFNPQEAARRFAMMEASQGAPGVPGMAGTPGGPVQESPTMSMQRIMQMAPNLAATGVGMYGLGTFNPPLAAGGGVGYLLTKDLWDNAQEPNIRDVWADQLRMRMQGR